MNKRAPTHVKKRTERKELIYILYFVHFYSTFPTTEHCSLVSLQHEVLSLTEFKYFLKITSPFKFQMSAYANKVWKRKTLA